MLIPVASRAHRCLRELEGFHYCRDEPSYCERYASVVDEPVIGVYENPPGGEPSIIVVTEKGLYLSIEDGTHRCLEFDDIRDFGGPKEKGTHGRLRIEHLDGTETFVGFEGRKGPGGKFQDVYEVTRFLRRVLEDRSKWRQKELAEKQ